MITNNYNGNRLKNVITHNHFETVLQDIRRAIDPPYTSPLIIVTGPAKVGKTTVRQTLTEDFEVAANVLSTTPVVSVDMPFTSPKGLNSVELALHKSMLLQLRDPYYACQPRAGEQSDIYGNYEPLVVKQDARSVVELRRQTLKRLETEHTKIVTLDMRETLCEVKQLESLYNFIRYLHSLAVDANIPFVIFGSYDLVRDENFLTEIYEKSQLIHFPRYKFPCDLGTFTGILQKVEQQLPLVNGVDFSAAENIQYLYANSLGCTGRLIEWLQNAVKYSVNQKKKALTINALYATKAPTRVILSLNSNIELGEKMLTHDEEDLQVFYGEVAANYYGGKPVVEPQAQPEDSDNTPHAA